MHLRPASAALRAADWPQWPRPQRDAGADVSVLERGMDQQVHALCGLTPEEIALVEKGESLKRRLRFAPAQIVEGTTP